MNAGDTFLIPALEEHLWIILSDPQLDPSQILLVNFTSYREDKELVCVVEVGDHPYISHKTCVNYHDAKVLTAAQLQTALKTPDVTIRESVSPALLQRMRNAAGDSTRIAFKHYQILVNQGLV